MVAMNFFTKTLLNSNSLPRVVKPLIYIFTIFLPFSSGLFAQDIHFSQFYNAPMNLNPALTGVFGGDVRFMGNYRSQWRSVPVDYLTFTAAVDMNFIRKTYKKGFFAGGAAFNYDQAGASKLNLTSLGLSGSYVRQLSDRSFVSVGAQLAAGQRAFKIGDLRFDNQYDDTRGGYDPTLPTGEDYLNDNNLFFDLSAGVNFRLQSLKNSELVDRLDKRNRLDVGIGLFHLNRPNQSFYDEQEKSLPMRLSPYMLGTLMLGKSFDLVGSATTQFQSPYREFLVGLGGKLHIDRKLGNQIAVQLGVGYRFNEVGDAVIPGIEISYNGWQAGFTYDINVSNFNVATNRRGGPEFSIRYIIRKVRPLPDFKICPLI
jgi:type IX secretion system PorP/SprF family membrane protein